MCQCNGTRKGIGNILGVSLTVSKMGQGIPLIILYNFYIDVHKYFVMQKISSPLGILTHECLSPRCEINRYHQVSTDSSCQQKPPPGHRTLGDSTLFSTPKSIDATFPGRCTDGWSGSRCNLQPSLLMDDLMRS